MFTLCYLGAGVNFVRPLESLDPALTPLVLGLVPLLEQAQQIAASRPSLRALEFFSGQQAITDARD